MMTSLKSYETLPQSINDNKSLVRCGLKHPNRRMIFQANSLAAVSHLPDSAPGFQTHCRKPSSSADVVDFGSFVLLFPLKSTLLYRLREMTKTYSEVILSSD